MTPTRNAEAKAVQGRLELMTQAKTEGEGLNAYWIDYKCCAPDAKVDLHTVDVLECAMLSVERTEFVLFSLNHPLRGKQNGDLGCGHYLKPCSQLSIVLKSALRMERRKH